MMNLKNFQLKVGEFDNYVRFGRQREEIRWGVGTVTQRAANCAILNVLALLASQLIVLLFILLMANV